MSQAPSKVNEENELPKESIRVITTFFAAVIGFGLVRILNVNAEYRWWLFIVAVFPFVRFLTGAANHLWLEHVKAKNPTPRWKVIRDLVSLMVFGFLAVVICYANSLQDFIVRALVFLTFVIGVNVWYWWEGSGWPNMWIVLNLSQFLAFAIALLLANSVIPVSLSLLILASAGVFIVDLWWQLKHLEEQRGQDENQLEQTPLRDRTVAD